MKPTVRCQMVDLPISSGAQHWEGAGAVAVPGDMAGQVPFIRQIFGLKTICNTNYRYSRATLPDR